ncbi:hypothetical protein EYR40_010931 [Pleurotus pulmonarius]|nr:hypothetical protein EYR40_010931 [Pleurotus pulmonarius]
MCSRRAIKAAHIHAPNQAFEMKVFSAAFFAFAVSVAAMPSQASTGDDIEEPVKLGLGAPCIRSKHLCLEHLHCCYSHANPDEEKEYGKCLPLNRACIA